MNSKILALIVLCLLVGFYLNLSWLVILLAVALFFMVLPSKKEPAKKSSGAPKEVLHPVIYEDVGEPPYLYPPKFEIKVFPEEKGRREELWAKSIRNFGRMIGAGLGLLLGTKKEKKEEKK